MLKTVSFNPDDVDIGFPMSVLCSVFSGWGLDSTHVGGSSADWASAVRAEERMTNLGIV